jgi:threonine dehydrogenase-like Zn-dependent dehydrogenase
MKAVVPRRRRHPRPGTILGHEGVGIVEEVGPNVRNLRAGDRVVIASTIGCGFCVYCRAGYYAQCDTTEPTTGTAFFGGPEAAGVYDGMQAQFVCVPWANVGCHPARQRHGRPSDHALRHLSDRRARRRLRGDQRVPAGRRPRHQRRPPR